MVQPRGPLLEERRDDHRLVLARQRTESVRGGPGDRLRQLEEAMIFDLAEVLRAEQLLGAEDRRAAAQGALGKRDLMFEVRRRVRTARHLAEADANDT